MRPKQFYKSESITVSVVSTEDPADIKWREHELKSARKTVDLTNPVSAPITSPFYPTITCSSSAALSLFSLRVVRINRLRRCPLKIATQRYALHPVQDSLSLHERRDSKTDQFLLKIGLPPFYG